jgi:KDO2-lipid IV(A) lauroyltransferase
MREIVDYEPDPAFAASLQKVVDAGRGRIVLTGHTGNWELQAFCYPLFFGPLTFLARRMDNPRIEAMIVKIRTRLGNKQIDKENSAGKILRLMRAGGSVGVLADVNAHPNEGIFVPFFGIPASTSTGIAMLAQRSGAVIVPMLAVWDEQKGKYKHAYRDIIEPDETIDRKADIERMTALCAAATESLIREYPDQYIWIHRRWKTRPPGEKGLY